MVSFVYLSDPSSFGRSAQNRPDIPLSRDCLITSAFCPGAVIPGAVLNQGKGNVSVNASITATTRIPENITTMFSSATKNSTIAGIFDIQYRFWKKNTNEYFDNRQPYVKGSRRPVENLLGRDNLTVVEGIIADLGSGGIGFRNHTGPAGLTLGGKWDEDILWIEPDISCANTNLSFEFVLGNTTSLSSEVTSLELVDEGGLSLIRAGNPYKEWPNLTYSNPDVQLRADRSAWLYNFLSTLVLNLTSIAAVRQGGKAINASLGHHYPLDPDAFFAEEFYPLGIHNEYLNANWLELPRVTSGRNGSITANGRDLYPPEDYSYEFASLLFSELQWRCAGRYSDASKENDYNVECGAILTLPSRVDRGSPMEEEPGSKWKSSLYVCAGAVKASVKTVSFSMNASASLGNLVATGVKNKHYPDNSSYPLWAIEDWWYPGSEGAYAAPLWGIVDVAYEGTKGYNFTRAPTLYLPYSYGSLTWESFAAPLDSLAGSVAPYGILSQVIHSIFHPSFDVPRIPRYDGSDSLSLRARWASLSKSGEGIERLLRLVWTDMMASTSIGANVLNNALVSGVNGGGSGPSRLVTIYVQKVTYDMRYAVPALLLLVVWVSVILVALMIGSGRITHLKQMLNDTSLGRVAAITAYPSSRAYLGSPTNEWATAVGHVMLQIGGRKSSGLDVEEHQEQELESLSAEDDSGREEQPHCERLLSTRTHRDE